MANRFFNVKITAGTSSGPYIVYHTSATPGNEATLHPSGDPAINLSYQSLTSVEGVDVMVPDTATNVILYNTNAAVIAECPTNTVVLNLGSTPTATPAPTATEVPPTPTATEVPPTPTPTATEVPPTPTPSSTTVKEPTPTPSSTTEVPPTPTPSSTSTPVPTATPTPTPTATVEPIQTAICEFIWVSPEVNINVYGIRYFDQANGIIETRFNALLGSPLTYGGVEGTVYGVCSTNIPQIWDSSNNTTSPPDGVSTILLEQGGVCVENRDCVYESTPVPTATPTSTPTPTPTFGEVACYEWSIDYPGSLGDPAGSVAYIDCDGIQQNDTVPPDSSEILCAQQILDYSLIQPPTNNGLCGFGPSATPTPTPSSTSTPVPTATPNPTGIQSVSFLTGSECYNYKLSHHVSSSTVCTNVQGGVGYVNYYMSNGTFNELAAGGVGYIIYINDGVTAVGPGYLTDGCQWWQTNGFGEIIANGSCGGSGPCCDSVISDDPGALT
jgi:hypothetical protein